MIDRSGSSAKDVPIDLSTPLSLDNSEIERPTAEQELFFGPHFAKIQNFADLLVAEGELRGLIGPRELPRLWTRHIVNSAAVLDFLPASGNIADVGSGAGFPGIVVAICRPDLTVHLIEPMARRVIWLNDVVQALDLPNVVIHQVRAQEFSGDVHFGAVTVRAVAALEKLLNLVAPLLVKGGRLLALKGKQVDKEILSAKKILHKKTWGPVTVHEVPTPDGNEVTMVVDVTKTS